MPEIDNTSALQKWYEDCARTFLLGHLAEGRIQDFDKDHARLKRASELSKTELSVCFLGDSGVGKSTLINAIIDGEQAVVPSGGVGPLTAQALVVRFGTETRFEVEYHGAGQVLRTVFGLEQMYKAELGTAATPQGDLEGVEELEESELVLFEPAAEAENDEADASEQARLERRENLRRRAQLLVTGDQDEERPLEYLLDSLREAAGGRRVWGTGIEERDAARVRQIQYALALAKKKLRHRASASEDGTFLKALHDHATGFLAPLIKSLELHWNAPVLSQGITLVDLPGVGVMRDVHRDITRYWIREKANALVLIVDHRGLHDSVAEALRGSEFLNSLLYSADEPDDDPVVMVAVTRIDDIANEQFRQDKSKKKVQHFLEVAEKARHKIHHEMQRSLEAIWLTGDDIPEARRKVVKSLLAKLQVHPVSAPEYSRLLAGDDDDPSFLKSAEQSGVPGFVESLTTMARARQAKANQRLEGQRALFRERLSATLRVIQGQWGSDSRAEEEAQKLKTELDLFMDPLRKELHVRQGAYRTFLRKTVPQRIDDLVETASLKASVQINRYLIKLGSAHWATLRASVRRGGRYSGASDINLPSEFALRFEEPVAEVWGKEILKDIRKETKAYASDCVELVEQVAAWALDQGARVQPKIVEAQRDAIRADAKKLESVGHEMVKEMRDEAKAQLINKIEGPIKRKCDDFVKRNLHVGPGVKHRILELYASLAEEVTKAAEDPATRILQQLFKDVEKEILDAFKEHENPLEAVADAIVASQESYIKRSDARKRRQVLEDLAVVLDTMPVVETGKAAN
jgi:GTP-binding protein EngB required for normal cell division